MMDKLLTSYSAINSIFQFPELEWENAELKQRLQDHLERERLELAQELHDGPMQDLYGVIFQLDRLAAEASAADCQALQTAKTDLLEVIGSLRKLAQDLRPPSLVNFGLEKAIRANLADVRDKHPGITFTSSLKPDDRELPEDVRFGLFRIYQTALMNSIRHAIARHIRVIFHYDTENAYLSVSDDGAGFQTPVDWLGLARKGHFGLVSAAERAATLGGNLKIDSVPGHGTMLRVSIPLVG
jgi:signal transduction histidine kinase